jgi:type IV secretory pathway TrbD component
MDAEIPGFVTPVHRALTEPILMGGAPRSIAIVNGTLTRRYRASRYWRDLSSFRAKAGR